jgi:hypothetical protein
MQGVDEILVLKSEGKRPGVGHRFYGNNVASFRRFTAPVMYSIWHKLPICAC